MDVRQATSDDAADLLAWRNDPQTRAMSRNTGTVDEGTHVQWLTRALADENHVLLIVEEDGAGIGVVRFSRSGDGWEVGITLAGDARGRKKALPALRLGIDHFSGMKGCQLLTADVRRENVASLRIFEDCGFRIQSADAEFYRLSSDSATGRR